MDVRPVGNIDERDDSMKRPFQESGSPPPNELAVVGERKEDPSELLLMGSDGHFYAYTLPDGEPEEIVPNDEWQIETTSPEELFG